MCVKAIQLDLKNRTAFNELETEAGARLNHDPRWHVAPVPRDK
jgi:hypothetical protein